MEHVIMESAVAVKTPGLATPGLKNSPKTLTPKRKPVSGPSIKQQNAAIVAAYIAKNNRMIRCQFFMYGIKGDKEMDLTWRIDHGNVNKRHVRNADILDLPYGYIKYLNTHNKVKRGSASTKMRLEDSDGNVKRVRVEEDEIRYFVRVLDFLSSEDLEDLDPSVLVKASLH